MRPVARSTAPRPEPGSSPGAVAGVQGRRWHVAHGGPIGVFALSRSTVYAGGGSVVEAFDSGEREHDQRQQQGQDNAFTRVIRVARQEDVPVRNKVFLTVDLCAEDR
jgi:hypothetical protein